MKVAWQRGRRSARRGLRQALLAILAVALLSVYVPKVLALAAVDLNTASETELESLPGVGAKTAQAIIAARPFKSVDDLNKVKGIGNTKFDKLKELVTVGGTEASTVPATAAPGVPRTASAPNPAATRAAMTASKPAPRATAVGKVAAGERINVNTASLEELERLPGIGEVKAKAIIAGRPYQTPDDVMKVKGIKQATFDKLKDHIAL